VYTAVHGPCTWSVRVPNTAVYAAGTWQNTAGYAARTRPCTGRIHGRVRAAYRVHGRLYGPCARPCMYHVLGRAWSVHDPNTAVYTVVYPVVHGSVYSPCRVHGRSRRVRTVYTTTRCIPGIAKVDNRNLLDGYYANLIIRSLEQCTLYTAAFTARAQYTARKRPCTADGHGRVYGLCTRSCTVYMHVFVACVYGRPRQCTD